MTRGSGHSHIEYGEHSHLGGGCLLMVLAKAVGAVVAVMADYPRVLLIILAILGAGALCGCPHSWTSSGR
jgi:hypothetical protein